MKENFHFRKFHNAAIWHVYASSFGRIGSIGQHWENGKRRGFNATVTVYDAEGEVTGYKEAGHGYKTRTEAAEALLAYSKVQA